MWLNLCYTVLHMNEMPQIKMLHFISNIIIMVMK